MHRARRRGRIAGISGGKAVVLGLLLDLDASEGVSLAGGRGSGSVDGKTQRGEERGTHSEPSLLSPPCSEGSGWERFLEEWLGRSCMDGRWSSWAEGDRPLRARGEARDWIGGRALLASEILLREGAPKAWAKDGSDCGG